DPDANSWTDTLDYPASAYGNRMLSPRANHSAVLLPNGKVLLTGGETSGMAVSFAEGFDIDFSTWQFQGTTVQQGTVKGRAHHTSVLSADGNIMNIGGYDGINYLDTTDLSYFGEGPDATRKPDTTVRQPVISTATSFFDYGSTITLLSGTSNFHGLSEASGGSYGSGNSQFFHPRVYIQSIDNPSGFMADLTDRVYGNSFNTDWAAMSSSITIVMPAQAGEIPYGWYHLRVAANAQFSTGVPVQVTIPRPTGAPDSAVGIVVSSSTINWTWNTGTVAGQVDGYSLYSSSDGLFIGKSTCTACTSYSQSNLAANTGSSVKIYPFNMGGTGSGLAQSATYYTFANPPVFSTITGVTHASFNMATLTWDANGNSPETPYELSMSLANDFSSNVSTPIPFSNNHATTTASVNYLQPNVLYYFRVRAMNGLGTATAFNPIGVPYVSTITVGNVTNLKGTALDTNRISWSWDAAEGASWYNVYDSTTGVFISSVASSYFIQTSLSTNTVHGVKVNAVMDLGGGVSGPLARSSTIYTLAAVPLPVANPLGSPGATGMLASWVENGNPSSTTYVVEFSLDNFATLFSSPTTSKTPLPFTGLTPNTLYYGRVYAVNGSSEPTVPLDLGSLYTLAKPPAGVYPATVTLSGVTLVWSRNGNPAGTTYKVVSTTQDVALQQFTVHISSADAYTKLEAHISGLLTSTTYHFAVSAFNKNNKETAATWSVPDAYTPAGPTGAPAGSIAGQASPSETVFITGFLPSGREVGLSIPGKTFKDANRNPVPAQVAVAQSYSKACSNLTFDVDDHPIEFAIYTENNLQPYNPVTMIFSYSAGEAAKVNSLSSTLVLARYSPVSGDCLPLETTVDKGNRTITATLNHFSIFQIMQMTPPTTLDNAEVYPNPFYPNRGDGFVTLKNLPASSQVKIYTLHGEKIWEGTLTPVGMLTWRGVNSSGNRVASGVYLCLVKSPDGKKKILKIAVER
ncbi:MAG: fibronectin type III domain-containing protein, partial [bacterium]